MAVQFQSYGGGPHGGSPIVLPPRPSPLGDIGQFMQSIGQIPSQMQAAQLKQQLNQLLMSALTTPQTKEQVVPGKQQLKEGVSFDQMQPDRSLLGMPNAAETMGDFFTQGPDQVKQVSNPDFANTIDRLTQVGPAFGMKFPTPIENIYAAALAKSMGAGELEKTRQTGRMELQGVKGEQQQSNIGATYEAKGGLEDKRQTNRNELLDKNIESKQKIATEHNQTLQDIAADRNANDQTKTDKILKERSSYHSDEIDVARERNKINRSAVDNLSGMRTNTQVNSYLDDLQKQRTQIDKILQKGTDPNAEAELTTAQEQYNALVDKVNQLDPSLGLSKMQNETRGGVANWLRSLGVVPGMGTPERVIKTVPNTPKANTPASQPATVTPGQLSPEELRKRRERIFQGLGK